MSNIRSIMFLVAFLCIHCLLSCPFIHPRAYYSALGCVPDCTEKGQMVQLDQTVTEKRSETENTKEVTNPDWRVG